MRGIPGFRFDSRRRVARFEVTVPRTNGRVRRRKTVVATSMPEALAKWKAFRDEVFQEDSGPITFAEFIERFWPSLKRRVKPKTARDQGSMLRHNLIPFFGKMELSRINISVVQDFAAQLREEDYAADSINNRLALLKKLLRDAVARELIPAVPVRGRWPREKTVQLRLELSREEQAAFLGAFDDPEGFMRMLVETQRPPRKISSPFYEAPRRFGGGRVPGSDAAMIEFQRFQAAKPVFIVGLETGLTQADLLGLKWSSVDFKSNWIRIERGKTRVPALIPLSSRCHAALSECRKRKVMSEFVFLGAEFRPYSVKTIQTYHRKAKAIARITRRFRFHDLRHTFASNLASAGVSLQQIARCLGHATTKMSERYARPDEASLQTVVAALDREFKTSSKSTLKTTQDDPG